MALKWKTDEERFFLSVDTMDPQKCWVWQRRISGKGYANNFKVGSTKEGTARTAIAHRWAYEHFVGPIPAGMQIDHLCRNRACVNPAHLEPVTPRENTRRGLSGPRAHCQRGHELAGGNLIYANDGKRRCRRCIYDRVNEYNKARDWVYQKRYRKRLRANAGTE